MYHEFYGLKEPPFNLNPDPRFLYLSENHKGALQHMQQRLERGDGFMVLLGEAGAGKTTILRAFLRAMAKTARIAFIAHSIQTFRGLLLNLCRDFGLNYKRETPELLLALEALLRQNARQGKRALLVIDEAHHLKSELLEEIRQLSNYETARMKLLQIIFAGQKNLEKTLRAPELIQLRERITLQYTLRPLPREEVRQYIRRRLQVAGALEAERIFSAEALEAIYEYTRGVPRLINRMCENALMLGGVLQARTIDARIIHKAELRNSFDDESTLFEIREPGWAGVPANENGAHETVEPLRAAPAVTMSNSAPHSFTSPQETRSNGSSLKRKLSTLLQKPFHLFKG